MRYSHALVPLCAALALTACGEDQTATAPATPPAATTATTESPAAPPGSTTAERPTPPPTATAATSPATTTAPAASTTVTTAPPAGTGSAAVTGTAGNTAAPSAGTGEATVTGSTGGTAPAGNTSTVTPAAPGAAASASQSAAAAPASLESFHGRAYSAGAISVRLNPDNTFEMNQTDGNQKVTGRYSYENGVLRLSEPQGDVGSAQFPMNCRFEALGTNEFRLAENNGSCARFKDLSFKSAAG